MTCTYRPEWAQQKVEVFLTLLGAKGYGVLRALCTPRKLKDVCTI